MMMTDPMPLELPPPLLSGEVALMPPMVNGDAAQQVILVQVNPGETFTIRAEDGSLQCIQDPGGPAACECLRADQGVLEQSLLSHIRVLWVSAVKIRRRERPAGSRVLSRAVLVFARAPV
ncbi:hypothetical protein AOLI_G00299770 [Acnodon oligacanthus]